MAYLAFTSHLADGLLVALLVLEHRFSSRTKAQRRDLIALVRAIRGARK